MTGGLRVETFGPLCNPTRGPPPPPSSVKETIFSAMRRGSIGPKAAPPLGGLDDVILRNKTPGHPLGIGPGFMRRSCTFVTEGSWRKSSFGIGSGQKETKDRVNLALQVRKKAAQLGGCEEDSEREDLAHNRTPGRVSRLVGNLKSWSSSEDVRQSVVGALTRTVNVIKHRPGSKKVKQTPSNGTVTPAARPGSTSVTDSGLKGKRVSGGVHSTHDTPPSSNKPGKHMPNNKTPIPRKRGIGDKATKHATTNYAKPKPSKLEPQNAGNKKWLRHLHDAQASYSAGGRNRRPHPPPHLPDPDESTPSGDLRDVEDVDVENESIDANNECLSASTRQEGLEGAFNNTSSSTPSSAPPTPSSPETVSKKTESGALTSSSQGGASAPQANPCGQTSLGGPRRRLQEVQIIQIVEGPSLIQPSEVKVSQGVVLSAEPVLTPIELLRRKDLKIRQELEEKQNLIADILNIPRQDFESVADMAGEVGLSNKDPRELALGAIYQAKKLQETLNEAQTIRDSDVIAAQASNESVAKSFLPLYNSSMDTMEKLLNISGTLTQFLNSLMIIISERDEERERMRKELVASRERVHQLHMQQNLQDQTTACEGGSSGSAQSHTTSMLLPTIEAPSPHSSRPNSFVSVNSSVADQSDTMDQHNTDEEAKSDDPAHSSGGEIQSASEASTEKCEEVSSDATTEDETAKLVESGGDSSSRPEEESGST